MDCQIFEQQLQTRLDQRLTLESPEILQHSATCHVCRELLADFQYLNLAVSVWKQRAPVIGGSFTDRMLQSLAADSPMAAVTPETTSSRPDDVNRVVAPERSVASVKVTISRDLPGDTGDRRLSWLGWGASLATAVAMLVLMLEASHQPGPAPQMSRVPVRQNRSDSPHLAHVPQPVPARDDDNDGQKDIGRTGAGQRIDGQQNDGQRADFSQMLASAGGAYSQLANETLTVAQDFALLWPTATHEAPPVSPSETSAAPADSWPSDWPMKLTPLGESVEGALDLLRRATPHLENTAS